MSCTQKRPTDFRYLSGKVKFGAVFMTFQGVNDLNSGCHFRQSFGAFPGGTDAHWQSRVRTTHGVRTMAYLSPFSGEVSRGLQRTHGAFMQRIPFLWISP